MARRDTLSDSIAKLSKMLHCRALYSTLDTTKIRSQLDSASAEYHRLEIYVPKRDTLRDSIKVLSKLFYHRSVTDNTIANKYAGDRHIPLLGLEASVDDYPTLLSLMLAVFSIIVALNTRSIHGQIQELVDRYGEDQGLRDLIRTHYTFTGLRCDHFDPSQRSNLTRRIEYLAYFLPMIAICLGSIAHFGGPMLERWRDERYYFGSWLAVGALISVHALCALLATRAALASISHSRKADLILEKKALSDDTQTSPKANTA